MERKTKLVFSKATDFNWFIMLAYNIRTHLILSRLITSISLQSIQVIINY